jgi:hypothetical protein
VHLARERLRTSDAASGYPALPVTRVTGALFSRPPGFATGPLRHAPASSAATPPRRRQFFHLGETVRLGFLIGRK